MTLNERLARYFQHPESKSSPANGVGRLARRHIYVCEHAFIGKESNAIKDDTAEESGNIVESDEPETVVREGWSELVRSIGVPQLADLSGIPKRTLYDIAGGAKPSAKTCDTIREAFVNLFVVKRN